MAERVVIDLPIFATYVSTNRLHLLPAAGGGVQICHEVIYDDGDAGGDAIQVPRESIDTLVAALQTFKDGYASVSSQVSDGGADV